MADICPFRGLHYNESLVGDLGSVICPPYDIIAPHQQQELYERNEYNFVRLEFGRELPSDTGSDNKYTRATATLEQWLSRGIIVTDNAPAIYLHDHHFTHRGKEYRRRGLLALVRLEEWDKGVVRPHEGTLAEPKRDRLNLLWALQANTSPILALYADEKQQVAPLLEAAGQGKPMIAVRTTDGDKHNIWAVTKPEVVNRIRSFMTPKPLYIADGHHRYESALTYRRERRACSPSQSGDEPFDFVMMSLVDFSDPGLVILPAHRLIRGISESVREGLLPRLKTFFEIEDYSVRSPGTWSKVDTLLSVGENEVRLALFGLSRDQLLVLRLRDFTATSQMMPYFHSEIYRRLSVSIVDHVILEELLGLSGGKEHDFIDYSYDRLDAIKRVLSGEFQLAVLLSPARAEVVKAIADAGDRMPRKSTYFYPKLPSGLVFYRLV